MIIKEQVVKAQKAWGNGVIKIGALKENRVECEKFTNEFLEELYAFNNGPVLFKPTKCKIEQFRPTKLRFENSNFILEEDRAIAMGNYFFTNLNGNEAKVEYTFGYKLINGELKIDVHHSSFPYAITEQAV